MTKIPTISQQYTGDINERLNAVRAKMNDDIKERFEEHLEKKKSINIHQKNL